MRKSEKIKQAKEDMDVFLTAHWIDRGCLDISRIFHEYVKNRRRIARYLRNKGYSTPVIANVLGYKCHTTVLNLLNNDDRQIVGDKKSKLIKAAGCV